MSEAQALFGAGGQLRVCFRDAEEATGVALALPRSELRTKKRKWLRQSWLSKGNIRIVWMLK
jgi:hypothetical protein